MANELKEIGPFSGKNKRKAEKNTVKSQNWNEKGSDQVTREWEVRKVDLDRTI